VSKGGNNVKDIAADAFKGSRRNRYPFWERLALDQHGNPKATLHNVITVLEQHEPWQGVFRFDEFSNRVLKRKPAPYGGAVGEFIETDAGETAAWFGDPYHLGMGVKSAMAMEAIEIVARRKPFHPVRDYLQALRWDETERLPTMLADLLGAKQDAYTARVGVMFMVSAVARIMRPGCKVDFMLVLEGEQGTGKSSFYRELFSPEWFAEAMSSPTDKDFYQVLQGRWVVEIPEMHAFSKAEVNKVKQAITTQVDVYRPSYGRIARGFARQNIFGGSTNDDVYLRDATGARRFLPVRATEHVNFEMLRSQRDQLWAEAYARFARGENYWDLPAEAGQEQDARYEADSWEEPVGRYLEGLAPDEKYPAGLCGPINEISISELMARALNIETGKHTKADQQRVGAILRRFGWRRRRPMVDGKRCYLYDRPKEGIQDG